MKRRIGTVSLLALVCLIVSSGFVGAAEGGPPTPLALDARVREAINYQGYLTASGAPVSDTLPMIFRLYSDDACTTQVGADIDAGNVVVTDGVFSVKLPVDQADFNGQGLWAETSVDGAPVGCEEILPAPYALSLRPGAKIEGGPGLGGSLLRANTDGDELVGAFVQNLLLAGAGVYGKSGAEYGFGGYFINTATGGTAAWFDGDPAGHFVGDVEQGDDDGGLVKAAAYVQCASSGASVSRQFNPNGGTISVSSGPGIGRCTLDFGGFNINDRFWTATSGEADYPRGVSCEAHTTNLDQLRCFHWNTSGVGYDGPIVVVVY